MNVPAQLVSNIPIPPMARIRQHFPDERLADVAGCVERELAQEKIRATVRPGMTVAITAGSRGIDNIALILKTVARCLAQMGAKPFFVPAMGSHGGATAEGQKDVLASYGITEEAMGFPIRSSMRTVQIGTLEDGSTVRIDAFAAEADGIVIVNRVKPHTSFRGRYESGLMKMMAIGLGKQEGAAICHARGYEEIAKRVEAFGRATLRGANVLFGVAIMENAFDRTKRIVALTNPEIITEEPKLLEYAKANMARILLPECDVLVVDEIGKNISGPGADPNVTGVFTTPYGSGGIKTGVMAVLDLSEATHGNATGIGLAAVTTKRCFSKIDLDATYPNALTNMLMDSVKIPMAMENQRAAIQAAIKLSYRAKDPNHIKLIRIHNTLELGEIWISEALVEQARRTPGIELLTEPEEMAFNEEGDLF